MLKFLLFWFVFRVLGRLPQPALYVIADLVAAAGFRLSPGIRANVLDNLRHAMPTANERERREAAKQVLRNVAYYYADLAHLPHMDLDRFFKERVIYHGVHERLIPNIESGRGSIMLSAHYGNPELVGQAFLCLGIEVFAVTEPVEPPRLSRMLDEIRSSQGLQFQPVGVRSVKHILQTLRSGGVVALMGDRDIEGPKMRLPFLGEEAWLPTGPIEVGLRTGAAIYPSFCARRRKRIIEAYLEEPIEIQRTDDFQADVRSAMMQYIERLEARLRAEPHQWAVLERIWDAQEAA
jgi:KDO2-lipid IV(A) lauroyltransferase